MNTDQDYDSDGNNIVPCPICLDVHCPSKEGGKCSQEDDFAKSMERKNIRKILFLDIDGVVNHKDTFHKYPKAHYPIEPYCAFLVGKIQLDTGCEVVLSSSWRHHPESVEQIKQRVVPLIDITGRCCEGIRGVEIHKWLTRNVKGFNSASYQGGEHHVANIAILDDDSDMLLWQKDHFFQTSFMTGGLTDEIAARVTAHLNREVIHNSSVAA